KSDLGYYAQANKYQTIPSQVVSNALSNVAYPIISSLNNDPEKQVQYLRKLTKTTAFLIFPIMLGLMGIAENVIQILLTAKWLPSVPYFKVLVGAAIFSPFQVLFLNTFNAVGRPNYNFGLEMVRNSLVILSLVCFHQTIMQMLYAFVVAQALSYLLDIIVLGRFVKYTLIQHFKDIMAYAIISLIMYILVVITGNLVDNIYLSATIQIVVGIATYLLLTSLFGQNIMKEAKELIVKKDKVN
ncbi:MAG: oligosaccharide flippase family protein, partial [Bacteroidales bacterium]|nr:oligosaccharide flippase family protein [Bacteroidales bacterium]